MQLSIDSTARSSLDAALYSPRKGHTGPLSRLRANRGAMTLVHLLVWYSFSTMATFTNKVLIKQHHLSAEMLTLAHLFVSVICDLIVLTFPTGSRTTGWRMQSMTVRRFLWILPLSLFSVMSKVLTYWSYDAVPVAFAHTCKASQPIFNVILAYLIYHSKFCFATYLSLVPIVVGVILASVSEMSMNDLAFGGAIFAISAALLGVVQSMYAKYLLRSRIVVDNVNLHFYSAFLSFVINAPLVLFGSSRQPSPDNLPQSSFPYMMVLGCSLMHFAGSFCASLVLSEVSELTYSIMSTMKRVVIIGSAIFYFGNPVTVQSASGMMLAVSGVGAYQMIKVRTKIHDTGSLPMTMNDLKMNDRSK